MCIRDSINAYSIKSLMVVPFMNLLKSTLSPIPCKCPVSEYCQILDFPLPPIEGCRDVYKRQESMKKAFRFYVTNGLGKQAESKMVNVAGTSGTIHTLSLIHISKTISTSSNSSEMVRQRKP